MAKIKKILEERKKVEGYMDYERNVFVVTNDNGLLSEEIKKPEVEENKIENIGEILKKYKPEFLK